jgi:drug/metabolite transporter (DMT)-like permease
LLAHAAVLGANIFFAVNYSLVKHLTASFIQPFGLNVARVAVSTLLFWLLWLLKPSAAGIQKKHYGRFFLCALSGVAVNQMLFIKGLSMTFTIHASLLMLTSPIIITVLAAWVLRERISKTNMAGLLLGIAGATLLVSAKENSGSGSNILLGDMMIALNAIAYAIYFVLVRPLMQVYHPVHVIRWVFTLGAVMMIPVGWSEFAAVNWSSFATGDWMALGFVVLAGTFLAYLFNIYGLQHLGAAVTGAYIYSQPLMTVIIAMVFVGEKLSLSKIIAAALIFTGVYLVSRRRPS